MKRNKLIILIGAIVVCAIVIGTGSALYINNHSSNTPATSSNTKAIKTLSTKAGSTTSNIANELPAIPKILLDQGTKSDMTINGTKLSGMIVGDSSDGNTTNVIFPNVGSVMKNISTGFEKANPSESFTIGSGNHTFKVHYKGDSGWDVYYNGVRDTDMQPSTTSYVPKVIKMSDSRGFIYAPASSSANQGFLIGYDLKNSNVFDWCVTINGTSTTIPRIDSFGLGNLMLNSNYGFYSNKAGILYLSPNSYTMLLQSSKYPQMRFVFNTGAKNNIEPLANMGYYNDSLVESKIINNNIPTIYPVSSTKGYIYQKPTATADGYIWFFNTNWNDLKTLNANGVPIPKGNYSKPIFDASSNSVTIASYEGINGTVATATPTFNGLSANPTTPKNGDKSLEIIVDDSNGNPVANQNFDVRNSSGQLIASNISTDSNGEIWLYGLPQDYYTITPVSADTGFKITEVVVQGSTPPVANLVYNNGTYTAPANLNSTTGTITVNVPESTPSANLYQNGVYLQTVSSNGANQCVFSNLSNGLYTVATSNNGYTTSTQSEVGLNSSSENASTSFYLAQNVTTGNIYAEAKSSDGTPIAGVSFNLMQNGNIIESQTTGPNGTVDFTNEPFGSYNIVEASTNQSQGASISDGDYTSWSYFTNN